MTERMITIFSPRNQTQTQADELMRLFVRSRQGEEHNAMTIMKLCIKLLGIRYDWQDWDKVLRQEGDGTGQLGQYRIR